MVMTYLAEILMLFMGQYGLVTTTIYHIIVLILIMIQNTEQSHEEPYVPKCKRLPRRAWIQSTFLVLNLMRQQLENHITNLCYFIYEYPGRKQFAGARLAKVGLI